MLAYSEEWLQRWGKVAARNTDITALYRPVDQAGNFVSQLTVLLAPLRPQHLLDGRLERSHPGFHRRIQGIRTILALVKLVYNWSVATKKNPAAVALPKLRAASMT